MKMKWLKWSLGATEEVKLSFQNWKTKGQKSDFTQTSYTLTQPEALK